MTEKEEKLLREYCARVLLKYGFEFTPDDPVIPALYTIYSELNSNKVGNEEVAKTITMALSKLNPTVYNFHGPGEAWKFKMAESMRWLFLAMGLVVAIGIGFIWWRQNHDVEKASEIISTSNGVQRMLMLSSKKDNRGYEYLEFSKAGKEFTAFWTEYLEVNKDTVRVYIGRQK